MARDENGKALSWNDPRTGRIRSKTFPGVAKAMAEQWAGDNRVLGMKPVSQSRKACKAVFGKANEEEKQ